MGWGWGGVGWGGGGGNMCVGGVTVRFCDACECDQAAGLWSDLTTGSEGHAAKKMLVLCVWLLLSQHSGALSLFQTRFHCFKLDINPHTPLPCLLGLDLNARTPIIMQVAFDMSGVPAELLPLVPLFCRCLTQTGAPPFQSRQKSPGGESVSPWGLALAWRHSVARFHAVECLSLGKQREL